MDRVRKLVGHITASLDAEPASECSTANVSSGDPTGWLLPKKDVLKAFLQDPAWAGKRFWMLNVLKYKGEAGAAKYAEYSKLQRPTLEKLGAKIVLNGIARTVIGRREFDAVVIVEYPSPDAFLKLATEPGTEEKYRFREEGLAYQYLVPLRPGWFRIDSPAPAPTRPATKVTKDNVWTVPNGMVGAASQNARIGETSASQAQAEDFVQDERFGGHVLWHLNLLKFHGTEGETSYNKYAKAMGTKQGVLSQVGARSTLAAKCYRSLIGEYDFDRAIIAEYPSRDAFFSMGASDEYLKVSQFRHEGLQETYIVSVLPEEVDRS